MQVGMKALCRSASAARKIGSRCGYNAKDALARAILARRSGEKIETNHIFVELFPRQRNGD